MRHESEFGIAAGVSPARDSRPAAWLMPRLLPRLKGGTQVGSVMPTGFPAYARVLHPARTATTPGGSAYATVRWSEVGEWSRRIVHSEMQWEAISQPDERPTKPRPWQQDPEIGRVPREVLSVLAEILAGYTSTPDRCWICFWEGFAGVDQALKGVPRVELPGRSYFLLRAPLKTIGAGNLLVGPALSELGPSIWWPDDHAWCVATEIDFRWTYVAGSVACVARVLNDSRLEALAAKPEHRADWMSDTVNGPVRPR